MQLTKQREHLTRRAASRSAPLPSGPIRFGLAGCGVLLVALGAVGIALPGLPATPFLLLASYCLARSSPSLHRKMLRSRLLGHVLRDWEQRRMVRRAVKMRAVVVVLFGVVASLGYGPFSAGVLTTIILCASTGILVISWLPSEGR